MKRRLLSILLLLAICISIIPQVAAQDSESQEELPYYDPEAAAAYAVANWATGVGQCAQFVCTCLGVGGIVVPNDYNYYAWNEPRYWGGQLGVYFTNPFICSGALLKWLSGRYEVVADPPFDEYRVGDVIFMGAGRPDGHTGIITGFDGDWPLFSAHNKAACNRKVGSDVNYLVKVAPRGPELCEDTEGCAGNVFKDMPKATHWSHEPIDYVYQNGLFLGTTDNTFSPKNTMTRAMLVTVLWRMNGNQEEFAQPFNDVPEGCWCDKQIAWAAANGIVDGMGNGEFQPDSPVTREQVATILLRYTLAYGTDSKERSDFASFVDGDTVSDWAVDALQWAVAQKIVAGAEEDGSLWIHPRYYATRAEVAALIMRFVGQFAAPSNP